MSACMYIAFNDHNNTKQVYSVTVIPANNLRLLQRFHNIEWKLWKRYPGKLRERCHNVDWQLWAKVGQMLPNNVAATLYVAK